MRKLAFAVVTVAALTGGFVGCGGGSTRKPVTGTGGSTAGTTAAAGTNGAAGTGVAGTGAAGDSSTAGTTAAAGMGAAGDTSAAGTTAAAGTGAAGTGAAGTGAAGTVPPPPPYCETAGIVKKPLPYDIGGDFQTMRFLNTTANTAWTVVAHPDCAQTVFPALNPPPDGGTDAGADSATEAGAEAGTDAGTTDAADGGDDTLTLQLNDDAGDAAADGGVADAPVDVPVDAPAGDAVTDGALADKSDAPVNQAPACLEFIYNPDPCVAANGGVATAAIGQCWSGVILQPTGNTVGQAGPGICIGDNALKVTFEARANVAGAIIKFGSTREGMNSTEFYLTLTTEWATYSTAIPVGELYNTVSGGTPGGVWNGFSAVGEPQSNLGGTYLFVRNIKWSPLPP
jgi:hypothetical protein